MNRHKIRLSSTDSINDVNKNNFIDVRLQNTSKMLPFPDVIGEVDAYNVFENERNNCNKYRLILTINPYCTNVLFNTLTEITRNEGSPEVEVVTDKETAKPEYDNIMGIEEPTRNQMIMNTEYSKETIGYQYHLGYDIFTNHLLRNKTYKVVNLLTDDNNNMNTITNDDFCGEVDTQFNLRHKVFNTIGDFMRYSDGTVVKYRKRQSVEDETWVNEELNKHLYLYDDVYSMEESINYNLSEENGWFGIINNSTIDSKKYTTKDNVITGRKEWESLDISRVLNNYENCEFIDMYPDRTLFSFNPKVNAFRKRLEYNWDIILTYPYRNDYCPLIVTSEDGKTNGLKLMLITKTVGGNGMNTILFRSYARHGLNRGDIINLYIDGVAMERTIKVTNVGNMSSDNDNNKEYYFYTTDTSLFEDMEIDVLNDGKDYRFRRIVSGVESEYYLRVFRKLPNLKNKKENLTYDIVSDKEKFEEYIYGEKMNASVSDENGNKHMIDFNKEQYRLAFARTIYNDASTQITFTDTIDIEQLIDNLGRPLHEIYVTVIKNNRGYKEWYGAEHNSETDGCHYTISESNIHVDSEEVEYSHCFGNLTSGFEFSNRYADNMIYDRNDVPILMEEKAKLGDVVTLNELGLFNNIPYETEINPQGSKSMIDEFYGDIVEYNPNECIEHVLQVINHRFNTFQREMPENDILSDFKYQEIERDDYDSGEGMKVNNIDGEVWRTTFNTSNTLQPKEFQVWQRPEGYYYQAHYPITLKEFGSINQSSHYDLKVKEIKPIQADGIYLSVQTSLAHNLASEDIVYLCIDDINNYKNDNKFELSVAYVIDKNTCALKPYNKTWSEFCEDIASKTSEDGKGDNSNNSWNWLTLCEIIKNGTLANSDTNENTFNVKLRRRNVSIPDYATRINHNKYLWRDAYRAGEMMDSELTVYPYTNDVFYINKEINFFLKRQDPYDYNDMYCKNAFPNDVEGNKQEENNNYYYKDETEISC